MNRFLSFWSLCCKDFLSEWRRRENINTVLFFGLIIIFLFSFAFSTDPKLLQVLSSGLFWIVFFFSSLFSLEKAFQSELDQGCLEGLLLHAPSFKMVYLSKWVVHFVFLLFVQIIVFWGMFFLYDWPLPIEPLLLVNALLLGNIGVVTLGTFYSALGAKVRASALLLPLLLFPMLIPLLLGAVYVTSFAFIGDLFGEAKLWLRLMVIFDGVFFIASLLTIDFLIDA